MSKSMQILIVDDEPIVGERLKFFLDKDGHNVEAFVDPQKALERITAANFDIVISDFRMGDVTGMQIMESATRKSPRTKVVMITGYATMLLARESMAKGAFDFIAKPFKMKEIRKTIQRAQEAL